MFEIILDPNTVSACTLRKMEKNSFQIGEVSRISGVSIRMLRYYDKLKLLVPSDRSAADYRLYSNEDLLRLHQILIGRELGLSLESIRKLIDDTQLDQRELLIQQRQELTKQSQITAEMISSVNKAIALFDEQESKDLPMNTTQIFDDFNTAKYADEAKERWGSTEAYKESARRLRKYDDKERLTIKEETNAIMNSAAVALKSGTKADDNVVMDIAERHRLSIDRWFYPCSLIMHCALAEMYESDQRFRDNIDKYGDGLTSFLSAAIRANANRKVEDIKE